MIVIYLHILLNRETNFQHIHQFFTDAFKQFQQSDSIVWRTPWNGIRQR
jgi:hypothetical protein